MRGNPCCASLLLLALLPLPLLGQEKKDDCTTCHEEVVQKFTVTRHHIVKQGCDSCHTNAQKHAESGDPQDVKHPSDATCSTCHKKHNSHARSSISCSTCHAVHAPPARVNCQNCHTAAAAEFRKPYKHQSTQCNDCHNLHTRTVNNDANCVKCHSPMRGPFVFEHAPVRTGGCASCHEPHGSANPRLLSRAQVHLQCLECHAGTSTPPAFHNLREPRYRNCTICHVKIHGSHVSRYLLR